MTDFNWTVLTGAKTVNGSIKRWVNSDKPDPEEIIAETENWFSQYLRVRRMQARAEIPVVIGDSEINLAVTVPNFLDPISLWNVHDNSHLHFIHEDELDHWRSYDDTTGILDSGYPSIWTVVGEKILFDTKADEAFTLVLSHYAKPTALSGTNLTNLYTLHYRVAFKAVAMGFSYLFLKDEQRATALFVSAREFIQQVAETDDLVRRGMEFDVSVS